MENNFLVIEEKFSTEHPHILKTCTVVPDQMIHEDLIDAQFNTKSVRQSLRRSYEQKFQDAKTLLVQSNTKLTEEETEKQAAGQARQETKESKETKQLEHRVAQSSQLDSENS